VLDFPPTLLRQAEQGEIDEAADVADNQVPPATGEERGQLLRAPASDATRGSLERHFDVRLAFQNGHRSRCSARPTCRPTRAAR
jgi:hypothetical protein